MWSWRVQLFLWQRETMWHFTAPLKKDMTRNLHQISPQTSTQIIPLLEGSLKERWSFRMFQCPQKPSTSVNIPPEEHHRRAGWKLKKNLNFPSRFQLPLLQWQKPLSVPSCCSSSTPLSSFCVWAYTERGQELEPRRNAEILLSSDQNTDGSPAHQLHQATITFLIVCFIFSMWSRPETLLNLKDWDLK